MKRRFSLEKDFVQSKKNDKLYGFMRWLSSYNEYLPESTFNKNKKIIMDTCGIGSTKTLSRNLNELISIDLVKRENGNFYFPFDCGFRLLSKDILKKLILCKSELSIRVYLYLLLYVNDNFTIKELKIALGYAQSTKTCEKEINLALKEMKELNLIDYIDKITYKNLSKIF